MMRMVEIQLVDGNIKKVNFIANYDQSRFMDLGGNTAFAVNDAAVQLKVTSRFGMLTNSYIDVCPMERMNHIGNLVKWADNHGLISWK